MELKSRDQNNMPREIVEPCLLFNLHRTFRTKLGRIELYDYTRHAWRLGARKEKAKYAMSIYDGIVQEVYTIAAWFPQNTTLNIKHIKDNHPTDINKKRWEFVGQLAPDPVRTKYLGINVSKYFRSKRNPIAYVNC